MRMREPPAELPTAPAPATTAEEPDPTDAPAVSDPVGRVAVVDGKMLTEAMFFRLGFARATISEMASTCMASVLWMSKAMTTEPWIGEAYKSGMAARDTEGPVVARRALDRLVEGYVLDQQKVTKDGCVVDYKEAVGPSVEAVKFQLGHTDTRYRKDSAPPPGVVPISVLVQINQGLREAGVETLTLPSEGEAG